MHPDNARGPALSYARAKFYLVCTKLANAASWYTGYSNHPVLLVVPPLQLLQFLLQLIQSLFQFFYALL